MHWTSSTVSVLSTAGVVYVILTSDQPYQQCSN